MLETDVIVGVFIMAVKNKLPLIGISGCRKSFDNCDYDCAPNMYMEALEKNCHVIPLIIPPLGDHLEFDALINLFDGFLFTGSSSNVEPYHYDGKKSVKGTLHDPHRDSTTLPLIRNAINLGVPVLCICRGIQELNVAYGGSLYQRIFEEKNMLDHRSDINQSLDERYDVAHEVHLIAGGFFEKLAGKTKINVNSLHSQGINQLGTGLKVEAVAPDGLIEAVSVKDASQFAVGVQWHPEYKTEENSFSRALFKAFDDAVWSRN